jgi:hypothetical protein
LEVEIFEAEDDVSDHWPDLIDCEDGLVVLVTPFNLPVFDIFQNYVSQTKVQTYQGTLSDY